MLQRAVEDNFIINNPVSGIKLRADKEIKAQSLIIEEQVLFLNTAVTHFMITCLTWQSIQDYDRENCLHYN